MYLLYSFTIDSYTRLLLQMQFLFRNKYRLLQRRTELDSLSLPWKTNLVPRPESHRCCHHLYQQDRVFDRIRFLAMGECLMQ